MIIQIYILVEYILIIAFFFSASVRDAIAAAAAASSSPLPSIPKKFFCLKKIVTAKYHAFKEVERQVEVGTEPFKKKKKEINKIQLI